MRRLLAVLRDTDGPADGRAAPQPSLANLDGLVEQVRGAGLPVELDVTGEPGALPPGVDLSAYRIVQEALTNVIKHAGAEARARVQVTYSPDAVALTVSDDGVGRSAGGDGTGHGLVGIRERVAVVGGRVDAGPAPGGGFAVTVQLPYALEPDRDGQAVRP
jgi:signal transduction histidine kinase